MWRWIIASMILLSGCTSVSTGARAPAAASQWGASLNNSEVETCSSLECESFLAPCEFINPVADRSSLEKQYRERVGAYRKIGYCMRPGRPLTDTSYAIGTCLFLMVRGERCAPVESAQP